MCAEHQRSREQRPRVLLRLSCLCWTTEFIVAVNDSSQPDTAPDQGQPLSVASNSKQRLSRNITLHRKAQGSLRILVKRHLDGCPSKNSYCFLPHRHSAAGSRGQALFLIVQHSQNGLHFFKATSSCSLRLCFEVRSMHTRVILYIRTCYGHTCQTAGDSRPVVQARHTLIEPNVARLKRGDGEGSSIGLHTRQTASIQWKASEAPGNHSWWRTHQAAQTSNRSLLLNQGFRLRAEGGILSWERNRGKQHFESEALLYWHFKCAISGSASVLFLPLKLKTTISTTKSTIS